MHVFRPLIVVLALAGTILIVRNFIVPSDFGVHESGYMYGWYRKSNEGEWKAVKVKYQGKEYCQDCHAESDQQVRSSRHNLIECENCHGPALEHPSNPAKLAIDRGRELCLRCHTHLAYPTSKRSEISGIDAESHNPGGDCVGCHNPHQASKPH
ncbi:MAG: cytochrome c3 family protein [Thermodesulfobacteriota bacterium]|nr:cytochrome c3 family protein [Thermodesulfobacteriota bacterium]